MPARLHKAIKLSPHKHTGKYLPHKSTSHGALLALLLIVGGLLVFGTRAAVLVSAAASSGSVSLGGMVSGPAPQSAAGIQQPVTGQTFRDRSITVKGTCPTGSFVQIFRNGIFAGTAVCNGNSFSLRIDLVIGKNDLVAKVFDNLGQFGPESAAVIVYYKPLVAPSNQQLLVTTESSYQGVSVGEKLNLKITIAGGEAPYAAVIKWGDGTQSVVAREMPGQFTVDHTYREGGIYDVSVEVTDRGGNHAELQTVVLVNGLAKPLANIVNTPSLTQEVSPFLTIIWPLYLILLLVVTSFWLGERYELFKLKRAGKLKRA